MDTDGEEKSGFACSYAVTSQACGVEKQKRFYHEVRARLRKGYAVAEKGAMGREGGKAKGWEVNRLFPPGNACGGLCGRSGRSGQRLKSGRCGRPKKKP